MIFLTKFERKSIEHKHILSNWRSVGITVSVRSRRRALIGRCSCGAAGEWGGRRHEGTEEGEGVAEGKQEKPAAARRRHCRVSSSVVRGESERSAVSSKGIAWVVREKRRQFYRVWEVCLLTFDACGFYSGSLTLDNYCWLCLLCKCKIGCCWVCGVWFVFSSRSELVRLVVCNFPAQREDLASLFACRNFLKD